MSDINKATEILKGFLAKQEQAPSNPAPEPVEKALNTKSMPILRPRPEEKTVGAPVTRLNSKYANQVGVAPLVGETLDDVSENEYARTHQTYKSCIIHDLMYKSDQGCYQCSLNKAMSCAHCGRALEKGPGGSWGCAKGCGV